MNLVDFQGQMSWIKVINVIITMTRSENVVNTVAEPTI